MNGNNIGRPKVIDDFVLSKLEDGFMMGFTDEQACFFANISPATLYRYIEANPEYGERKELLKDNIKMIAKKNLKKFLDEGDKDITKFIAERKMKDEFSLKTETELTGKDGKDLIPAIINIVNPN